MNKVKYYIGIMTLFILVGFFMVSIINLPNEIVMFEDEQRKSFIMPIFTSISTDDEDLVTVSTEGDKKSNNDIYIKTIDKGNAVLDIKLFGIIPVKTVSVNIIEEPDLVVCGKTAGIKMTSEGVMVLAVSDVVTKEGKKLLPCDNAGISPGDLILSVDGLKIENINQLRNTIENSQGQYIRLTFKKGEEYRTANIKPVRGTDDDYHIGLWVRDSIAGMGTITFVETQSKKFAALGHCVNDSDLNKAFPFKYGEIYESKILKIVKGKKGKPGEIAGEIDFKNNKIGDIRVNDQYGLYGYTDMNLSQYNKVDIKKRSEVQRGKAQILSDISGQYKLYDVNITWLNPYAKDGTKGFTLRINDPELMELTGGIIQGMSGSPVLQDNKLIGAVTHVFVNEPDKGYGIFADSMLKNIMGNNY